MDDYPDRCMVEADSRGMFELRSSQLSFLHDGFAGLRQAARATPPSNRCGRRP